jgi:hypothetical protein
MRIVIINMVKTGVKIIETEAHLGAYLPIFICILVRY